MQFNIFQLGGHGAVDRFSSALPAGCCRNINTTFCKWNVTSMLAMAILQHTNGPRDDGRVMGPCYET
jgi:hypothetical protein